MGAMQLVLLFILDYGMNSLFILDYGMDSKLLRL